MKPKTINWKSLNQKEQSQVLQRPGSNQNQELKTSVQRILEFVRADGDSALKQLTEKFDRVAISDLRVSTEELSRAKSMVSAQLKSDITEAARRIEAFHSTQVQRPVDIEISEGIRCERRFHGIDRVGLYIPGGTAPLFSTVLMLAVPAKLAGCTLRVLATPPRADGSIDPHILFAAELLGITEIFKIGGAQAIAALAYGTESVPKVYKIFGPGNSWVTEAKLQVSQDPGGSACDLPAGPSEVLVIADKNSNPSFVAADLLSQAEHGEDSHVVFLTDSEVLLEKTVQELGRQLVRLPRKEIAAKALSNSVFVLTESINEAVQISNRYAPEHLILQVENSRSLDIRNAGSVFLGTWSPESVGDYASGTNHVLPTYGFAKAYSGLSLESFQKSITYQELSAAGLAELGPIVIRMAEAEGLEAHANAVRVRLEKV